MPATSPFSSLLSFIAKGEGGYNSMNQGTVNGRIVGSTHNAASILGKNLTDMTIGEVVGHQSSTPSTPRRLFAAGRYQIIPSTLKAILPLSGLTERDLFNQANQDKLGIALIKNRKPAWDYLTGKHNDRDVALLALAKEWASLPDPRTGNSYYGEGNKAQHSLAEVTRAVDATRAALTGSPAPAQSDTPLTVAGKEIASSGKTWLGLLVVGGLAYALWRRR